MPFPPHPRIRLRRRSLFASAAGAALVAGCTGALDPAGPGRGSSAADRARARAARDSEKLAERYAAVIAAHPALAARLEPLRVQVVRHAHAFGSRAGTSASPSASASPSTSASPAAPAVPADPKAALAGLAQAERALADRRTDALLKVPGELARLMASVAAAGAAHVYLLTEGGQ
ncbi:hypothetical protein ABZ876_34560 [Streptomyces sp. NPDC046931]|uniref:hypothetical protein n=1 Tax=Streptomyces sp. NPDC046931 TaxID=3154806 RepID=UPI0033F51EBB